MAVVVVVLARDVLVLDDFFTLVPVVFGLAFGFVRFVLLVMDFLLFVDFDIT
jgi:hypothetical protein